MNRLRAENVRSEVADVTSIVKYIRNNLSAAKRGGREGFLFVGLRTPLPSCFAAYGYRVKLFQKLLKLSQLDDDENEN